jgi:hypothetical protein
MNYFYGLSKANVLVCDVTHVGASVPWANLGRTSKVGLKVLFLKQRVKHEQKIRSPVTTRSLLDSGIITQCQCGQ